jgi:hypothetical protein
MFDTHMEVHSMGRREKAKKAREREREREG